MCCVTRGWEGGREGGRGRDGTGGREGGREGREGGGSGIEREGGREGCMLYIV